MSDERKRAGWCSTVGPVLTEARARPVRTGPVDRLVFISWNTHVGGGDLPGLISHLREGQLTDGTPVGHFVLLLQEVYRAGDEVPQSLAEGVPIPRRISERPPDGSRREIRDVARSEGLELVYVPEMRNGHGLASDSAEDRGNAILSTEPLDDITIVELPLERQRHVAVIAAVKGETSRGVTWDFRVVTVHLDTAIALTHGGPLNARTRQVDALTAAVQRVGTPSSAVVIGGDLNTWFGSREPAVQRLRRDFPDTLAPLGSTWRGVLGLHATLDHFFARLAGAAKVVRAKSRFGSDHYPLIMSVEL